MNKDSLIKRIKINNINRSKEILDQTHLPKKNKHVKVLLR